MVFISTVLRALRDHYTPTPKWMFALKSPSRLYKRNQMKRMGALYETRITAACLEHGMDKNYFLTSLAERHELVNAAATLPDPPSTEALDEDDDDDPAAFPE
ncbi:hypothetical protein MAR_005006 [Mya arenaria]|uniref:Uncharacterized protein n=1 Tax=Mya arenaria TaxID=6604 RepID=A0ABY7F215_MYAAR|nr:hypothetical protein MAR_005006 [Mya arenaria]